MNLFAKLATAIDHRGLIVRVALTGNRNLVSACWIAFAASVLTGCSPSTKPDSIAPNAAMSSNPLSDMKAAVRGQVWNEAWMLADPVLEKYPNDPDVMAMVAMVAHNMQHPDRAAELLVDACRTESFKNEQRVQQAIIALVQVGRLHDSMDLLETALAEQPMQHETRRLLYDLCMGTEDRPRGMPHGQILIRYRKFDLDFLLALSNTQQRTQEAEPLIEMASRNPDDIRPLVGQVRIKFDQSKFDETIQQTREIVAKHPDFQPAQLLLGRALAGAEKLQDIQEWAAVQDPAMKNKADYWLTLGDWSRAKGEREAAVRSYWEATRCEPDRTEPWSKLSASLQVLDDSDAIARQEMLDAVDRRVALLSTLNQSTSRFERTGKISRAVCLEIIKSLEGLGRLWEAEAWASIALTLPEDEAVPIAETRQAILAKLSSDTPWQLTAGFPELETSLSRFKLPAIEKGQGLSTERMADVEAPSDAGDPSPKLDGMFRLEDEATARGVRFLASTGNDLDEPGIMLYETLGCGGGAIDFDLDGWCDLYFATAGGTPPQRDSSPNALMRNQLGTFVDVTDFSNTGDTGFGQGVAVGDVNEDGFPDLMVLNYGPNTLYLNNGDGTFSDRSERIHSAVGDAAATAWSTSGAIADLDGDSIADIVILNYCAGLGPVNDPCPMADSNVVRSCSPMKFPALVDQFIQQQADGTFADRTIDWNAIPEVPGRGLGIVVGNLDHAPGNEVFIANDMTNNHYWSRSGEDASFQLSESAMPRGLAADDKLSAQGSMGIACADFDADGDIDCYVTNFDKEYNTYHEQVHDGVWQDRTSQLKLTAPTIPLVGFGTQAVDFENDGSLEMLVTNGHVDLFSRGDEHVEYAQPMQIFRRNADSTFESIEALFSGNYTASPHVGRALWTLDVNRDARTDLVVTHQTEPVSLLVNQCEQKGDWIELQLCGTQSSRDAIGAVVTVACGDRQWVAPLTSGSGYLCRNEPILRFGIGKRESPLEISVAWPVGPVQVFSKVSANQRFLLIQGEIEPF